MKNKSLKIIGMAAVLLSLSGCAKQIFTLTAGMTETYSADYMVPDIMQSRDVHISCAMGEAMVPLIHSMSLLNSGLDKITLMTMMTAATCSQEQANEQELRYLRALKDNNTAAATDARILMKQFYAEAAKRQFNAYNLLNKQFGKVGKENCPRLLDDQQQLTYLIGLLSGLQAVDSDMQSTAGLVPRDIAARVERGAKCLDNEKWFGIPMAMRATVWTLLPGGVPQGEDNWQRLAEASAIGEAQQVRLAHVLYAMAARAKNRDDLVRAIIKRHAHVSKQQPGKREYRLLDTMATVQLRAISDQMWTAATGHRTPFGELGSFWDEQKTVDLDGIDINEF